MELLESNTSVLLFGSQADSVDQETLEKIQKILRNDLLRKWILETVAELPQYYNALSNAVPKIEQTLGSQGAAALADFETWLRLDPESRLEDSNLLRLDSLPSVVLSPMIVLMQLAQYRQYLQIRAAAGNGNNSIMDPHADLVKKRKTATLGFCMGLLAAFAVASAKDTVELDRNAAVAVRLAMLGGAVIDAQDEWNSQHLGYGPSKSFATAWRNEKQRTEMQRVVDGLFPEAYISVLFDKERATVTTTERAASKLLRRLHAVGITTAKVGFSGEIHSPKPESKVDVEALINFCDRFPELRLPGAAQMAMESYTNSGNGRSVDPDAGPLHQVALHAALAEQCSWYETFAAVQAQRLNDDESLVVTFGPDRCVPPTLMRPLGSRAVHFADLAQDIQQPMLNGGENVIEDASRQQQDERNGTDVDTNKSGPTGRADAIAVVGMSIKVAGAEDLNEFSEMLKTGESQHQQVTSDRLAFDSLFRENEKPARQYYANLMSDVDAFDHKFFKKSPRECAAMDPQQRLFLQAAYQAVEQSGYFTTQARHATSATTTRQRQHVGVYVGAPAVDYEHNVACHPATSFTATGNLQSFLAGRIAHYFGWTGSAITLDTACSSSAVAIHMACRNLLSGECNAALAGGVALFTNPVWFENLAVADFLSPSGQCKPFDNQADGFCRGEGIACVFLKRSSDAIADGDPILGYIASSAVYQNDSSTPMFVPNAPSLSRLFKDVISDANLSVSDFSLVEAHGTGTRVGDPAEYNAIRSVLGGPKVRSNILPIGSLKGHIGHTEGASGAASLIKVLLMMLENYIPAQASFSKLSSAIDATPSDHMGVVTSTRTWSNDARQKRALINNYGASGSNAAMVVTQALSGSNLLTTSNEDTTASKANQQLPRLPFQLTGLDKRSIKAHGTKLAAFMEAHPSANMSDLSFNINRQANNTLPNRLCFSSDSTNDLNDKLRSLAVSGDLHDTHLETSKAERPVILCFGGQTSTYIGLDRAIYDSAAILRFHLGECDSVIQSQGQPSIKQFLFLRNPIEDTVKLQTSLFALQYACAKTWLSCGLSGRIAAVVGHSFGEITALCISGVLTLTDAVRLIIHRARLVRDTWGHEKGAMMAVDGEESIVQNLLQDANQAAGMTAGEGEASIACYNGPHSFTLGGTTKAIDTALNLINQESKYSALKAKKLMVTNAYHTSLVQPLLEGLNDAGTNVSFHQASIPIEHATETSSTEPLTAVFVADHMRKPVYFNHAIQRLARDYPSAVFLEAGSRSTITSMARHALTSQARAGGGLNHFQAINITGDHGLSSLTDSVLALMKQGLAVSFWPHHAMQTEDYSLLILPPYQFEKTSHWLDRKSLTDKVAELAQLQSSGLTANKLKADDEADKRDRKLWTFVGYGEGEGGNRGSSTRRPRFRINTDSALYKNFVSGHVVAQTAPVCPGTLQMDIAIECFLSLDPDWKANGQQPVVTNMVNHAPICMDPSRAVSITFTASSTKQIFWDWEITSTAQKDAADSRIQKHVSGQLHMRSLMDPAYMAEFARYERVVPHSVCKSILDAAGSDTMGQEVLQGRSVYRAFTDFVDYSKLYRNVDKIVGKGEECAGRVRAKYSGNTWLDVPLDDSFCQVAGLWINCMTDLDPGEMCVANGCELMMRSTRGILHANQEQDVWDVYARRTGGSDNGFIVDVFVFHAASGELAEIVCGIKFSPVPRVALKRILNQLTTDTSALVGKNTDVQPSLASSTTTRTREISNVDGFISQSNNKTAPVQQQPIKPSDTPTGRRDVTGEVRQVVATVSGLEIDDITLDMPLADIGIDSLLAMELGREIKAAFDIDIPAKGLMQATNSHGLAKLVSSALGTSGQTLKDDIDDESLSSHDNTSVQRDGDTNTAMSKSNFYLEQTNGMNPESRPKAHPSSDQALQLSSDELFICFEKVKMSTDKRLREFKLDNIDCHVIAATNQLTAALIVEAFQELGCDIRGAAPGDILPGIQVPREHERLMKWIYSFLETDARLIDQNAATGHTTRTGVTLPNKSSEALFEDTLAAYPDWAVASKLIYHAGSALAGVLSEKTDGISVLFGSETSREMVAALYRDHPFNVMLSGQMCQLMELISSEAVNGNGVLKILEMGAGTGGTTDVLLPFLASLGISVQYTFTDLSPSMVAAARRKYGSRYPFTRFAIHDIEKPIAEELRGQHVVIASNAVHATHDLVKSATNIHSALRSDGFLMLLEQTECMPFSNLIFGLLEGWWLFDDGREHAIVSTKHWEKDLQAAGFAHVDWTDGQLPENNIQRILVAMASGPKRRRLLFPDSHRPEDDMEARQSEAETYVRNYTTSWKAPHSTDRPVAFDPSGDAVVIVTGTTGSMGSHLVAGIADNPRVARVVCINDQLRSKPAVDVERQDTSFRKHGVSVSETVHSKLHILESDTSLRQLGLADSEYQWLVENGTHIVHNAWLRNSTHSLSTYEPQFQTMRNLLDLAREIAQIHGQNTHGGHQLPNPAFCLVSSAAVNCEAVQQRSHEERDPFSTVRPTPDCRARWVCERMLDDTLYKFPNIFRVTVLHPGQMARASIESAWQPAERSAVVIKSAQALTFWPDLGAILPCVRVRDTVANITELLQAETNGAVNLAFDASSVKINGDSTTHSRNKTPYMPAMDDSAGADFENIVPFEEWLRHVYRSPMEHVDNPAVKLAELLADDFKRMLDETVTGRRI